MVENNIVIRHNPLEKLNGLKLLNISNHKVCDLKCKNELGRDIKSINKLSTYQEMERMDINILGILDMRWETTIITYYQLHAFLYRSILEQISVRSGIFLDDTTAYFMKFVAIFVNLNIL